MGGCQNCGPFWEAIQIKGGTDVDANMHTDS